MISFKKKTIFIQTVCNTQTVPGYVHTHQKKVKIICLIIQNHAESEMIGYYSNVRNRVVHTPIISIRLSDGLSAWGRIYYYLRLLNVFF